MDGCGLNEIADIDAHAKLEPLVGWHVLVSLDHRALDLDRAPQRIDDASKQGEQPIARRPRDPTTMLLDLGFDELAVMGVQLREGALIVGTYQTAITGDIGHQDGHQSPLDLLAAHSFSVNGGRGIVGWSARDDHWHK